MSRKYFIRIKNISNDQNNLTKTAQSGTRNRRNPPPPPNPKLNPPTQLTEQARREVMEILRERLDSATSLRWDIFGANAKIDPKVHGWALPILTALGGIGYNIFKNIPGNKLLIHHIALAGAVLALPTIGADLGGTLWVRMKGKFNKDFHTKNIKVTVFEQKQIRKRDGSIETEYDHFEDKTMSMHDIYKQLQQGARIMQNEGAWRDGNYIYFFTDDSDVPAIKTWCDNVQKAFDNKTKAKVIGNYGYPAAYIIGLVTYYQKQINQAKIEESSYGGVTSPATFTSTIQIQQKTYEQNLLDTRGKEVFNDAITKVFSGRTPSQAEIRAKRSQIENEINRINKVPAIRAKAKSHI